MDQVSTAEFYEAVKEVAQGITSKAAGNAKVISDYVEQTKQTNYVTLKDVFMTINDKNTILNQISDTKIDLSKEISNSKIELMKYVDTKTERQTRLILSVVGIGFTIMIVLIGFMYNAISLIRKP